MPGLNAFRRAFVLSALALVLAAPLEAATIVRTFTFSPSDVEIGTDPGGLVHYALKGSQPQGVPGGPEVPAVSALVDLPSGMRATHVTAVPSGFVSIGSGARVRPMQKAVRGGDPMPAPVLDSGLYSSTAWIPGSAAELGPSGSMRGRSLAGVVLFPVEVVPATGEARVATRIEVTLEIEPEKNPLVRQRIVPEWEAENDRAFESQLEHLPAYARQGLDPARRASTASTSLATESVPARGPHPFTPSALPSVLGSPVQYLIITNQALAPTFQTLADWKTEQGVPAVVRTVEFINQNYPFGVDVADRIRMFIRDAYTQWGTQYVMLGGDTPIIPVRYIRTLFFGANDLATDLYYSDLDGNWDADGDSLFGEGFVDSSNPGDDLNLFPDVYVGRAPVETSTEASIFVNKVLTYNKNPASGFICRALFFAEVLFPQDWQPGQTIASDGASLAEHAIQRLTGCIQPTRLYENYTAFPGALPLTKRAVIDSMEAGYNILHHVGHGFRNTMSCGDSSITNPDITPLTDPPAGLMYAIDCTSGAIDFESIGEEFILAPNGGAVTNIGSTNFDFPATGDGYQNEFYDLIFTDGVTEMGMAQALQKVPFVAFSGFDNVQRWTQMSILLLGDPSLRLWTQVPSTLTVTFPNVTLADTSVTVTVKRGVDFLQGAKVCLYKAGEEFRVGTTNASGQVLFPFRPSSLGSAKVTVTFPECKPFQGTLTVGSAVGAVALVSRSIDAIVSDTGAGTNGNANGVLDAGETVNLTLPARNTGGVASGAVTATLLSMDARASVLVSAGTYGVIGAGGVANGTAYRLSVNRLGVKDGDEIHLRLVMDDGAGKSWRDDLYLTARAPDLRVLTHVLTGGNADQVLDIGETCTYSVTLLDASEGSARNVTATLAAAGAGVTVLDGNSAYGAIAGKGQVTGDTFQIRNDSSGAPRFTLTVSDAYATLFTQSIDFTIPAAPSNLVGRGSASSIQVVWSESPSSDVFGYNVYRSANPGGPWEKRNYVPGGRISFFQDEGLAPLTRYYYYATSVDSSMNESVASPVVSASTNPAHMPGFPIPMGRTTPSSPVVGDLERDGELEVVVGSDYLWAWHSDGTAVRDADGSERTSGDFTNLGSYYASAPAITDLDNDGVMDIVALTWDTKQLFVFEPDGSVKSGFPINLGFSVWSSPAIGDIDGDGFKEIVFNSNANRVYAFRYNGTEVRDGDSNPSTTGVFALVGSSDNYSSPALADLDGDGKPDIIAAERDGSIYAWRYNGTNIPGFPVTFSGTSFSSSPAVADIDNDGMLEIVIQTDDSRLVVVKANGTAQPGFPVSGIISGSNTRTSSPALADMDGDGKREIITAGSDGMLRIVKSNGTFYTGWSGVRFSNKITGATESSPVASDLDGDTHLEILIGSEDGQLYGFTDNGQPLAGFPIRLDGEVRGTPMIWDFDMDGSADILLAGWDKNMYAWKYPGTYHVNNARDWVMFRHDGERTGRVGPSVVVGVEDVAAQSMETIDGGIRLRWKIPPQVAAEGGRWQAFRIAGPPAASPARTTVVPDGYVGVAGDPVQPDADGWITIEDRTVAPGARYSYMIARVQAATGASALAYGPYGVLVPLDAPAHAYLSAAFPNPSAAEQTLSFGLPTSLPAGSRVRMELYDVRGQRVRRLVDRAGEPGRFSVVWNGADEDGRRVGAGIYLVRFAAGPYSLTGRLVRLGP